MKIRLGPLSRVETGISVGSSFGVPFQVAPVSEVYRSGFGFGGIGKKTLLEGYVPKKMRIRT